MVLWCGFVMCLLVMTEEEDGADGADYADEQHAAEGFEEPGWIDELDHLRRGVSAVRIETRLLADWLRLLRHGSFVATPASHA